MAKDASVDPSRLPVHVGIIMDGNGRWASMRNMPRTHGHNEGLKAAKRVVQGAVDLGIRYVTLYAFSTENWKRAREEVSFLWDLIKRFLVAELDFYRRNKIRVLHIGDDAGMPEETLRELRKAEEATSGFDGLTVVLALNYGGRDEIVRAVRKLAARGVPAEAVDQAALASCLDLPDLPDPDLIIRPSGELRTSNFLLWQSAYSELYFTDVLWPDWTADHLERAVAEYQQRDRRFGGVKK